LATLVVRLFQEGNEEALLEILTSHTLEQREIVAKEYKMHHRKVGKHPCC
jgi:hypothetical protein